MKLRQLYPDNILSSPEPGIQELTRGILVRTNFVPGVRHVIGWRGLKESFTFNLEEPPAYMRYLRRPANEIVYDAAGRHWENPSDSSHEESLYLGYGKGGFKNIIEAVGGKTVTASQDVSWEKGKDVVPEYKEALWWKSHQISDYKTVDKNILGIDDRPQLIVLTGFLGSGKTSFLQHFIEYQVQLNRFVAIIQNEIGEIGLDGKLLDHDYAVTEIDEGCVCCTLVGNLKNAIHQILSSFHPDYIVLETTGLANPYNLLDEISELDELVRFDSITTIVDGLNVKRSLNKYEVAGDQIKAADIILLNKKDLLTDIQLKEINQILKEINPAAPILGTTHGDINPSLIYSVDLQDDLERTHKKELQEEALHPHHSHEHDGLSSLKITFSEPLDKEHFIEAIRSIPPNIFRIKGVIDFIEGQKPMLFQYVGGRFEFSEFNNPKMVDRFLVVIGQDIQQGIDLVDGSRFSCTPQHLI
ncbi:Metal chaperone, involved in Zn homeostasis [Olavius algarvensis Delta 1 endosymbiont]|nr:Metal chaperone, involved in Zn homeostasis [Olavius algarvensis Delta 1 endosymbiont]